MALRTTSHLSVQSEPVTLSHHMSAPPAVHPRKLHPTSTMVPATARRELNPPPVAKLQACWSPTAGLHRAWHHEGPAIGYCTASGGLTVIVTPPLACPLLSKNHRLSAWLQTSATSLILPTSCIHNPCCCSAIAAVFAHFPPMRVTSALNITSKGRSWEH